MLDMDYRKVLQLLARVEANNLVIIKAEPKAIYNLLLLRFIGYLLLVCIVGLCGECFARTPRFLTKSCNNNKQCVSYRVIASVSEAIYNLAKDR
ncbi:hypothetical protein [Helicobacter sp.]|uniref:hypothetical protein n=1 Tax=Helicobacter sp. TaxID=218 RepID=UPI0019A12A54|nr:hypothetical protein [Helicobacter sp.]MBD5165810.1 hypothetical protein [Helicobacter sp.]